MSTMPRPNWRQQAAFLENELAKAKAEIEQLAEEKTRVEEELEESMSLLLSLLREIRREYSVRK